MNVFNVPHASLLNMPEFSSAGGKPGVICYDSSDSLWWTVHIVCGEMDLQSGLHAYTFTLSSLEEISDPLQLSCWPLKYGRRKVASSVLVRTHKSNQSFA